MIPTLLIYLNDHGKYEAFLDLNKLLCYVSFSVFPSAYAADHLQSAAVISQKIQFPLLPLEREQSFIPISSSIADLQLLALHPCNVSSTFLNSPPCFRSPGKYASDYLFRLPSAVNPAITIAAPAFLICGRHVPEIRKLVYTSIIATRPLYWIWPHPH
jgi:hypothetical protein